MAWKHGLTTFALISIVVIPLVNADDSDPIGTAGCAGQGLVPESIPVYRNIDLKEKQALMESLFDRDFLEEMDNALLEDFYVPSIEEELRPLSQDPTTVARQMVDESLVTNVFSVTSITVPDAEPPTISSLIRIREWSSHQDRWYFYVSVQAFCGGSIVGYGSNDMRIEDKRGKNDGGTRLLKVPFKELVVAIDMVEHIEVTIFSEHCQFGWFSGKEKECTVDTSSRAQGGSVSEILTLTIA